MLAGVGAVPGVSADCGFASCGWAGRRGGPALYEQSCGYIAQVSAVHRPWGSLHGVPQRSASPPIPYWHTMLVTGVLFRQKDWVWRSVVACREPAWIGYFSHHPCKVWVAWPLLRIWHPWGASLSILAGNGTRHTQHRSDAA